MNSSTAATLPLTHTSSHHQRVRALFFSSASDTGASSSFSPLPTRLSLAGAIHHAHDATWRDALHWLEAYSPKCLVEKFYEDRLTAYYCGTTATASISTKKSGCARPVTNTTVMAGGLGVWGQAFWNAAKPACSGCPSTT